MKVCLVSSSFPRFDNHNSAPVVYQGSFVYELAQYLVQRGHQVHVVTPLYPNSPESEVRNGVSISRFRYWGWQRGWVLARLKTAPFISMMSYVLSALWTTRQVIEKDKLQIIHTYWVIPGGFIGVLAGWLTGLPVVATAPGSDLNVWSRRWLPRQLIQFTLRRLDGLFTLGSVLGKIAIRLGMPSNRVTVNLGDGGINLDLVKPLGKRSETRQTWGIPVDAPVVLFVGSLHDPKRVDHLILAMKQVVQEIPTARLCIVGEGPQEMELRQLKSALGLEDAIFLLGSKPHDEIPSLLEAADLFAYPSDSEGLPSAIREALTMGLPVVASRVGGIPDIIHPGETGFLVEPGDVEGLAESIMSVLRDPVMAQRLGTNAQMFAHAELDKEVIMPRIEAGYRRALNCRR